MPTTPTKSRRRRVARTADRKAPVQNKARRQQRAKASSGKAKKPVWYWPKRLRKRDVLPGWGDLSADTGSLPSRPRASEFLEKISTARFAFLLMAVAALFTVYVGHVHATKGLLAEVQEARRENLKLHLKYNRLKGEFDRATGPTVVYKRARGLGLEEGIKYGPTIKTGQ